MLASMTVQEAAGRVAMLRPLECSNSTARTPVGQLRGAELLRISLDVPGLEVYFCTNCESHGAVSHGARAVGAIVSSLVA
jgi:hypothetical protein